MLTRPLRRLVAALSQVAHHSYENPIPVEGPSELREIASAAETMRESVIAQTSALAVAEQTLTIRAERDRVAADLHDLTIQRVFALGMRLSGLAARHPAARTDLNEMVDEADVVIKELRAIIFELGQDNRGLTLRDRITRLMSETAPALGFAPVLEIRGDLEQCSPDLANDLVAVVREGLSNVARHARASSVSVLVEATPTGVRLEMTDDGVGLGPGSGTGNGLTNLRSRARRNGGEFVLRSGDGNGTTLLWSAPWAATR
jgi:signal transduction histidine kinase